MQYILDPTLVIECGHPAQFKWNVLNVGIGVIAKYLGLLPLWLMGWGSTPEIHRLVLTGHVAKFCSSRRTG